MNLRMYYQKIRDMEKTIVDEFPLMVSKDTEDGGKTGTKTEVSRHIAAKMLVEGIADLAEPEDVVKYRTMMAEAKRVVDQAVEAAAAMQVTVISKAELDGLRATQRGAKE